MRRAFSLIELVVVLVVMGIVASIAIEILLKVYKSYAITKATNRLVYKTDLVLGEIASKLQNRVKASVIADECNVTNGDCINGNIKDFISITALNPENASKYPVLEWINIDTYSKRGEWNSTLKRVIPGWSGFVDLRLTENNDNSQTGDYNITIPYSQLSFIQDIEGNYSEAWGVAGYKNVFENNISVLLFSGPSGRGDFNDINHSYGWWKTKYSDNKAQKIYAIVDIINSSLENAKIRIKAIDDDNNSNVYEGFFILNGASALVPSYNKDTDDYNITYITNYFPWKNQDYTDGNKTLLATHVTEFKFKEVGGLVNIYICIQDPNIKVNESENLTICKEKVIF